jgi:hypothetical protein
VCECLACMKRVALLGSQHHCDMGLLLARYVHLTETL